MLAAHGPFENKERLGILAEAYKKGPTAAQEKKIDAYLKEQEALHEKRMEEYEKEGFYTREDGKRSNALPDHKNPAFPKRPIKGYIAFTKLFGAEVVEKAGGAAKIKSMKERGEAMKRAFDKMTKKQEKAIEKFEQEERDRFEREKAEFEEKGYYNLEDGTRSDMVPDKRLGEYQPKRAMSMREAFYKLYRKEVRESKDG